jgi:hypothetical protein
MSKRTGFRDEDERARYIESLRLFLGDLAMIDINDMDSKKWRTMSELERALWKNYYRVQGLISFCWYPTAFGQSGCVSCSRPAK